MPELPEVETIKNDLLPKVAGRCFTDVILYWPKAVRHPSPEEFRQRLIGQAIQGLSRRGKYLIFHLSGGETLVLHLKMSGSLLLRPSSAEHDPFTRTVFGLDGGWQLRFSDPRKFGALWLVQDEAAVVGELGPEALDDNFTPKVMTQRLEKRRGPIKPILCDQKFVAGVGNIYADEALFEAGLSPLRGAGTLSREEVGRLHLALRQVLLRAIDNQGSSVDTYRRPSGEEGSNQNYLRVFRRTGQPCERCGTPIQRITIRNRGTHFCPKCQAR